MNKWWVLLLFTFVACQTTKLPTQRVAQYSTPTYLKYEDGEAVLNFENPQACPLRFYITSENKEVTAFFKGKLPLLLSAQQDTTIRITTGTKPSIELHSYYGNPKEKVTEPSLSLPILPNRKVRIIQAYQGSYSHTSDYSKYAIDFAIAEGDTICAAAEGVVVGLIEAYQEGGDDPEWRNYSNTLTLFHPKLHVFTQYVHLAHQGSLVEMGETVQQGQKVALAGLTGYTDVEHLHFNVLKAVENNDGLESIPVRFKEGYDGSKLQRDDWVIRTLK